MDQQTRKKGLLAVSFGTSYAGTRPRTLEAIENDLRTAFPDRCFYRAWTSAILRRKVEQEEGRKIYSVAEALERMAAGGVQDVLVQPIHLLAGEEFQRTRQAVCAYRGRFDHIAIGWPLLADETDVAALARVIEEAYPVNSGEVLALMGHGSACLTSPIYALLEQQFCRDGCPWVCIGTVEFTPGITPVLSRIRRESPRRVHLAPLLLVVGDHAMNDMSGDGPDSWKNQIVREGPEVICHLTGLGQYEAVRALYVQHARRARAVTEEARE